MALIAIASSATVGHAQFAYPPGYGGFGWGGWGGGQSVPGSIAQGMGAFAAGAGQYNLQTAQAASINTDTAMRFNEYMYESQQNRNQRYYAQLAQRRENLNSSREKIYDRLRNSPNTSDVERGDALNVALDELNNPKVYARALTGATAKVPGEMIRDIPFQKASAAITSSVHQITRDGVPDALKTEVFQKERDELRAIAAELRKQDEESGQLDPATLERARTVLQAAKTKVDATYQPNTRERRESERWLKAAMGLTRLLETPAINVLLAGVEKRPNTTLADLLQFMKAFNLRFGAATTARQREVYNQLFPVLDALRDQVTRGSSLATNAPPPATGPDNRPAEFFSGMDFDHLQKRPPAPSPPQN
jgi:hypothetical protein